MQPPLGMNVPLATYRLQLLPHLSLQTLATTLDYLHELGIRDVYLSPCFAATSGSTHGYDVVDFAGALGLFGEGGIDTLRSLLEARGMRAVLDVVPNHMSSHALENRAFRDVLERGEHSQVAHYFDVEWDSDPERKLVLPCLPEPLEQLLEQRKLSAVRVGLAWELVTPRQRLPINPDGARLLEEAGGAYDPALLGRVLALQCYRLVAFQEAVRTNYRRYLDVNELAALCMDDVSVLEATHRQLFGWIRQGWVSGLRVDHPDGLAAPASYFARLRERAPYCWLLAEKPLRPSAPLPAGWQVDGTTGYDFLALSLGLFIDPQGLRRLEGMWAARARRPLQRFSELAAEGKRWVLRELLPAELARAARLAASALGLGAEEHRECVAALEELIVALPVGRTFIESGHAATAEDRRSLWVAASAASATRPELGQLIWRLVTSLEHAPESRRAFCARFQQLCAAAAAKGVEDTAFYRYGALIALAELGCDPDDAAFSVDDFHQHALEVQQSRPRTMNTTSTHDTKRGEDARLRLAVLSEMPGEFGDALARFQELLPDPRPVGEPLHQHLLQTLVACWPISEERLTAYALKAARETKDFTSWRNRNAAYEEQLAVHVRQVLQSRAFISELERFLEPVLALSRRYSLSQLLLKLTAPGVPDVYQGSELWEEHLVDPDNRRPVDFALRHRLLAKLRELDFRGAQQYEHGRWTKLWLLERVLRLRRELPQAFVGTAASYAPLEVQGRYREQVVAFARGERVLVVAPRLLRRAPDGLLSTHVTAPSAGPWRSLLSSRSWQRQQLDCAELLGDYPVELLVKEP